MAAAKSVELVQSGFATIEEAAGYLKVKATKINEMLNDRTLPFIRPARKRVIPWASLYEYAAAQLDKLNAFDEVTA